VSLPDKYNGDQDGDLENAALDPFLDPHEVSTPSTAVIR
jgi:hypothetical protein